MIGLVMFVLVPPFVTLRHCPGWNHYEVVLMAGKECWKVGETGVVW